MIPKDDLRIETFAPLCLLEGQWEGWGTGTFPTLAAFTFREHIKFSYLNAYPWLHFEQRAWELHPSGEQLVHWETGFITAGKQGTINLQTCHMNGRIETAIGHCQQTPAGYKMILDSQFIKDAEGLKSTRNSRRVWQFDGDTLDTLLDLATDDVPVPENHIRSRLNKLS